MSNQIHWTALPGGRHDAAATSTRLSLFVSLRIEDPAGCPEIDDWPASIDGLRFRVIIDGASPSGFSEDDGTLRRVTPIASSSAAWKRAFGHISNRPAAVSAENMRSSAAMLADANQMLTFDARKVGNDLQDLYRDAVRKQAAAMTSSNGPIGRVAAFTSARDAQSSLAVFRQGAQHEQFNEFYQPTRPTPLSFAGVDRAPLDFNQTVALISQYPHLMRLFGVVVDFDLDLAPDRLIAQGRVRVEPVTQPTCPAASVWTAFQSTPLGGNVLFSTRPKDAGKYRNGFLFLGADSPYHVSQEDIDGQRMKVENFLRYLPAGDAAAGSELELPAQRTVGFTLIHSRRAQQLSENTRDASALLASANFASANGGVSDKTLFLEDLSRAIRPDVRRDDQRFLSLCTREVDYRIGNEPDIEEIAGVMDEGLIAGTITKSGSQLRVHEALFRFDGYGLCVDRPFAVAEEEPGTGVDMKELRIEAIPKAVKGSLPALRYGSEYRVAARVVDVAGGGLTLEDTAALLGGPAPLVDDALSSPTVFVRREPIGSPLIVPVDDLAPGESDGLIAVRTDHRGRTRNSTRHLLPPRVAVEVAERSGVLDGMEADDVFDLLDDHDETLDRETYPANGLRKVPYLADPLARHARLEFLDLPNQTEPIVMIVPFQKNGWPDANGILIELRSGDARPELHGNNRPRVRVELPPGHSATVLVQSIPDFEDLRTTFLAQYGLDNNPAHVAHPALAPAREIRLVHAVEQPLAVPAFTNPQPLPRGSDDTFVQIDDRLAVDVNSTGRITAFARWEDPIDAPSRNREEPSTPPGRAGRSTEAFSFPLEAGLDHVLLAEGGVDDRGEIILNRHHLGTTGHRRVEYRLSAETRFPVFFPKSKNEDRRLSSEAVTVDVPNAAPPASLSIRHVFPVFDWQGDEESVGRRRHWVQTHVKRVVERRRLGRRLRVYVERPCLLSGFEEQLGVVLWPAPLADLATNERQCLRKVVTQWALDPIWNSAELPDGPFARHFPLAETVMHGIELREIPELAQPANPKAVRDCSIEPGRLANRTVVAGHKLHFDERADAWYADIEVDSGDAYFPFVRLGLVRFQPISQPGSHASKLTFADFAQLAPDRYLTLSYVQTPWPAVEISLVGPGYEPQSDNRLEARIEVQLETPRYRRTDLGWEPLGEEIVLSRTQLPDSRMAWGGALPIPVDSQDDTRLTIREYEVFRDPGTGMIRQRLTYSDIVPLQDKRRWY